jgi:hypothetical protein
MAMVVLVVMIFVVIFVMVLVVTVVARIDHFAMTVAGIRSEAAAQYPRARRERERGSDC